MKDIMEEVVSLQRDLRVSPFLAAACKLILVMVKSALGKSFRKPSCSMYVEI